MNLKDLNIINFDTYREAKSFGELELGDLFASWAMMNNKDRQSSLGIKISAINGFMRKTCKLREFDYDEKVTVINSIEINSEPEENDGTHEYEDLALRVSDITSRIDTLENELASHKRGHAPDRWAD